MDDDVNAVEIRGRIGRIEHTMCGTDESPVFSINMRVVTRRSYKNKEGAWVSAEQWHSVQIVSLAIMAKGFPAEKGDTAAISGHLEYSDWVARDGTKMKTAKIVVGTGDSATFERSARRRATDATAQAAGTPATADAGADPGYDVGAGGGAEAG